MLDEQKYTAVKLGCQIDTNQHSSKACDAPLNTPRPSPVDNGPYVLCVSYAMKRRYGIIIFAEVEIHAYEK